MKNYLMNWNMMRVLRLIMGIYILVFAVQESNIWFGVLGAIFSLMPLFNIGCCGVSSCSVPRAKNHKKTMEISYEEVK